MKEFTTGTLYGVGVGPGDPELITIKAIRVLKSVPVIAWPAPLKGASLARKIASPHIPDGLIEIPIRMPLQVQSFPSEIVYAKASKKIMSYLEGGRDVAVICEGDPFLYGSFIYLFGRMADLFPTIVVPGITSITAAAAALHNPLAAKSDTLIVLPAPLEEDILEKRISESEAVAIIKIGRNLGKIQRILDRLGLLKNSRYIEYATMCHQRILSLEDVEEDRAPYLSIVLVHQRKDAWR